MGKEGLFPGSLALGTNTDREGGLLAAILGFNKDRLMNIIEGEKPTLIEFYTIASYLMEQQGLPFTDETYLNLLAKAGYPATPEILGDVMKAAAEQFTDHLQELLTYDQQRLDHFWGFVDQLSVREEIGEGQLVDTPSSQHPATREEMIQYFLVTKDRRRQHILFTGADIDSRPVPEGLQPVIPASL